MRTTSSDAWTDRTILRFTHPILETYKFAEEACSISMTQNLQRYTILSSASTNTSRPEKGSKQDDIQRDFQMQSSTRKKTYLQIR